MQWTIFFVIFCTFIPQQPEKLKFWKNEKNTWRCYHFTHVYHKWQSYDKWFLRYGAWQTELFVILDNFLQLKNQNFEKMKKSPGDIILQKCIKNHDNTLSAPEIWHVIVEIVFFFILGNFLPFYLLLGVNGPKNQNFKKKKKTPGDVSILHVYQKLWLRDIHFQIYGAQQTDGWTDGKSDT